VVWLPVFGVLKPSAKRRYNSLDTTKLVPNRMTKLSQALSLPLISVPRLTNPALNKDIVLVGFVVGHVNKLNLMPVFYHMMKSGMVTEVVAHYFVVKML
jgi:hypothetical protein